MFCKVRGDWNKGDWEAAELPSSNVLSRKNKTKISTEELKTGSGCLMKQNSVSINAK